MKILFCQRMYGGVSGEDRMGEAWIALLKSLGHEVAAWMPSFSESSPIELIQKGINSIGNPLELARFSSYLKSQKPDMVIFGNLESLSPYALSIVARNKIPTLHIVHNFRMVCSTGILFREGRACLSCPKLGNIQAVQNRCVQDSVPASAMVALRTELHQKLASYSHATACVAPSQFLADQLAGLGAGSNFEVLPNWVSATEERVIPKYERKDFLFVGRFDRYKGVEILLDAWQQSGLREKHQLLIAGGGVEQQLVLDTINRDSSMKYLGLISADQVRQEMSRALCVLVPSLWQEPFGLVAIEALSTGTPVITSGQGALSEIVTPECGTIVDILQPGALDKAWECTDAQWQSMSQAAFRRFNERYSLSSAAANVSALLAKLVS